MTTRLLVPVMLLLTACWSTVVEYPSEPSSPKLEIIPDNAGPKVVRTIQDTDVDPPAPAPSRPDFNSEQAASIKAVIDQNSGQLRFCYETQLRTNPYLQGKVELKLTLASGRVSAVNVVTDSVRSDPFMSCVKKKVKLWEFDAALSGSLRYPFQFRPS